MSDRNPDRLQMLDQPVAWAISERPIGYLDALAAMERRTRTIADGGAAELVWLLEHPPLYTAGTSAKDEDLLDAAHLPVFKTGRGGQFTYHGPGQRVAYVMLNLKKRGGDVRAYVAALEAWIIATLAEFNVKGEIRANRVGVWVRRPNRGPEIEDKIAAIGVRVSRGITSHGIALNVEPDLSHYRGIVPCGIAKHGVTSLTDLGLPVSIVDADVALRRAWVAKFGPVSLSSPPI